MAGFRFESKSEDYKMNVSELINELENFDANDEVVAVQQPNYPLVAELDRVGSHQSPNDTVRVYIHLYPAYEYYPDWDDEDDED